jgi:hypothetical protein
MVLGKSSRAVISLILIVLAAGWTLHWNYSEDTVYEAAIREAFSDSHVTAFVILNTTQPDSRFGMPRFYSDELGLPLITKLDYTAKNIFRFRIQPKIQLFGPVIMVDRKELDNAFSRDHFNSRDAVELRGLLSKSWGVITLSRVGFDLEGKHAVLYAQLTYCGLCGQGTYLYLSKESGTWHIVARAGTWIS